VTRRRDALWDPPAFFSGKKIDRSSCLGGKYAKGEGVARGVAEAIYWSARAAATGVEEARAQLAKFLPDPDIAEALCPLARAAARGNDDAEAMLEAAVAAYLRRGPRVAVGAARRNAPPPSAGSLGARRGRAVRGPVVGVREREGPVGDLARGRAARGVEDEASLEDVEEFRGRARGRRAGRRAAVVGEKRR